VTGKANILDTDAIMALESVTGLNMDGDAALLPARRLRLLPEPWLRGDAIRPGEVRLAVHDLRQPRHGHRPGSVTMTQRLTAAEAGGSRLGNPDPPAWWV
jgi:hypothetical protein